MILERGRGKKTMDAEQVWREVLVFLRKQDGVDVPPDAAAETLAAREDSIPICVTLRDGSGGKDLRSFLRYQSGRSLLLWTAYLLEKSRDRRKFVKLLWQSGSRALEFCALAEPFTLASLRLDNGDDGPRLCCVQDVAWGLNTDLTETMLREMRCAMLLRDKLQGALCGEAMALSLDEYGHCLRVAKRVRQGDAAARDTKDGREKEKVPGFPDVAMTKDKNAEIPQRVLDITEALKRGDLVKARLLACGHDILDVPREI